MERLCDRFKRLSLCLGHENCADPDGDGASTAEEEVDAEGGLGQQNWGDEGNEEVGHLDMISTMPLDGPESKIICWTWICKIMGRLTQLALCARLVAVALVAIG